ncbi:MAG: alpha-L-fucosidase [Oscillospiraceae bacterium]|nr:alpha-L-fucosidase [Oscillospiraceae bacterium]
MNIANFFASIGLVISMLWSGISTFALKTDFSKDAWYLKPPPPDAAEQLAILPAERQIMHAEMEFYAFFHFGINTFTDSELGTGREDPAIFNPTKLDTDQWIKGVADAGMKGAIITAKHHDGFCLWPTEYSEFSVKNSPYQGDVVAEFAESCRKYGVKFGFYLSPFDMNAPSFGQGVAYNDYFVSQLGELLSNYGDVFEVWFDNYITEEYKGRQDYDWDRWVAIIRELQPNAVIAVGPPNPDVAWVGNESGLANGNVSSVRMRAGNMIWAKSECDVSIRDGWFYHENQQPKTLAQLMHIYYNSVGMNCALLLNIPPNKDGLVNEKDIKQLVKMKNAIEDIYARPVTPATVTIADKDGNVNDSNAVKAIAADNAESYAFSDTEYIVDFKLDSAARLKHIVLSEDSNRCSERIQRFSVYAKMGFLYVRVGTAESAGNKTIVKLSALTPCTDSYRIVVEQSKAAPVLRYVGLYR